MSLATTLSPPARGTSSRLTEQCQRARLRDEKRIGDEVKAKRDRFVYTQHLYPATVRVIGGDVSGIKLVRESGRVDYSNLGGAGILMLVGDALEIESQVAPVLQVIPVKVR